MAEKYVIDCITMSQIGQDVILVAIYVKTFKIDVIDFVGNIIMCLTSN